MRRIELLLTVAAFGCVSAFGQHGHAFGHEPVGMEGHEGHMDHMPLTASASLTAHPVLAANLSTRLAPLLPSGTTLQTAATGFKSLGQFVATLHVAHNLNIPFAQLQAKMTGTNPETLGQAVQALEPNLTSQQVKADVKIADRQTKHDLEESSELPDKR